jgi:PAS domain S-box-containing protein
MTRLAEDFAGRILEGSPDAILVCDRSGTLRYWNRGAERVFGFLDTEAVGRSMDLIIPDRLRARHWAGWQKAIGTGVTAYDDGRLLAVPALHQDGRQISIEFSLQMLKNAHGDVEWVVAVIRDVTERYNRQKNLEAELKALRQSQPATSPLTCAEAASSYLASPSHSGHRFRM